MPAPTEHRVSFADDYKETYAYRVGTAWHLWDITLRFGATPLNRVSTSGDVSLGVRMSPQVAKSLLQILGVTIAAYEQNFGEIRVEALASADVSTPKKEVM
jgi:uncharacterized protein DUF3467